MDARVRGHDGVAAQAHAAETIIKCPQRVRMESGKVADSDKPPNFRSAITQGLNAYVGPPENEKSIKARQSRGARMSSKR